MLLAVGDDRSRGTDCAVPGLATRRSQADSCDADRDGAWPLLDWVEATGMPIYRPNGVRYTAVDVAYKCPYTIRMPPPGGMGWTVMDKVTQRSISQRLASASGHMGGIERMVRSDAYCVDVITQIRAVQAALDKISVTLLDSHLRTCVATAVQAEDQQERVRVLAEVLSLFDMSRHFRGRAVSYPNSYEGDSDMTTKTFTVPNISCGGCANTIERKVGQLAGVTGVRAVPATKQVTVNWEEPATWDKIQGALQEINYPPAGSIPVG